jgi:nifR3 family TIM-barrel protein
MPKTLKFKNLELKNQLLMAPLCGITDHVFRALVQAHGASLTHPEMVSSAALARDSDKTRRLVDIGPEEGPVGVQLFGSRPEEMAEAARVVERLGASLIGINFGCPVPKVVAHNGGSALLKDPALVQQVVAAVVQATALPVVPKIRIGWDKDLVNALEVGRRIQDAGAHGLIVHGRTRAQKYSGEADWGIIAQVKRALCIPVVGNGDLFEPEDVCRRLQESGVDGVLLARGAMGNPWLFSRSLALLETGILSPEPSWPERVLTLLKHIEMCVAEKGPRSLLEMRKHAMWYLKGLPNSAEVRQQINQTEDLDAVRQALQSYADQLSGPANDPRAAAAVA